MLFIVKPTAACNGACVYCSAYKEDASRRPRMTLDVLSLLFQRVREYLEEVEHRRVRFLWHGGEPMLMGPAFYREVLRLSREVEADTGVSVHHAMQSNITLVTDRILPVLKELLSNGRLGSSYDPVPGIRLLRTGSSYEDAWRRGFEKLRAAGIRVGVVYVAHKLSLGRAEEIYHQFKSLGVTGIRLNPLYASGLGKHVRHLHISPREWGEFLYEMWEVWNRDGRRFRVAPLGGWEAALSGRKARLACSYSGHCTVGFTGVDADGTLYSCGRSMDSEYLPFGNLADDPLSALFAGQARRVFLNRQEWLLQGECAGCRWWPVCHGGCPNDSLLAYGDMLRKTYWCDGIRLFLEKAYGSRFPQAPVGPVDGGYEFDLPGGGKQVGLGG